MATNEMYRRLQERTYRERLSADVYDATRKFLRQWIPTLPPSYRLGLSRGAGQRVNELCSQISEGAERPSQPPADWDVAPQMTRGLFSKDTVVYILVPRRPRPSAFVDNAALAQYRSMCAQGLSLANRTDIKEVRAEFLEHFEC